MKDELNKLQPKTDPTYIICNYQTSNEKGSHWVALLKDKNKDISYYFDSIGITSLKEAIDFLDTNKGFYSTYKMENLESQMSGILSLYVLFRLSKGADFFEIISEMNKDLKLSTSTLLKNKNG